MEESKGGGVRAVVWVVIAILVIWGIYAVVKKGNAPAETGPIKIGLITPLTGDAASLGEFIKNVTDLAITEINANGGVNGQPISVITEDDKCTPSSSVSAAQKLITSDGVKIILGSTCSGGVLAMLPVTDAAGVFVFSGTATSPDLTNKSTLFARTIPSDANQGKALADFAVTKGWKKVALLQESSDYALGVTKAFEANYTVDKGTIVKEVYPSTTTDFRSVLTKLKASSPDVIFFNPQSPGTIERIMKNFTEMKWNVPVMANDVLGGNGDVINNNKTVLEGAFVAEQTTDLLNSKSKALNENYKKTYSKEMIYKSYAQAQYDLIYILAEGFKKLGNDPVKIAAWVRTLKDWDGASGKVTINSNGDPTGGHAIKVIKNGKSELQ